MRTLSSIVLATLLLLDGAADARKKTLLKKPLKVASAAHGKSSKPAAKKSPGASPSSASSSDKPFRAAARTLHITNANTGESADLVYDTSGSPGKSARGHMRHLLRCRKSGRTHAIHDRLLRNLYATSAHFGHRNFEVVSGFRFWKVSGPRRKDTPHHTGRAIDFRINGVNNRKLADYLHATFKNVGVGWYPNSSFVHLDVRDHNAVWVDLSGPGEKARYVKGATSFDDYKPKAAADPTDDAATAKGGDEGEKDDSPEAEKSSKGAPPGDEKDSEPQPAAAPSPVK